MEVLLTVIVTWLSINFGLPAIHEHPRVDFVSSAQMLEVRYSRLASNRPEPDAATAEHLALHEAGHGVHAIYDDLSRTIYLPEGWTGATPAEVSVLVHELVHHLQTLRDWNTIVRRRAKSRPTTCRHAGWSCSTEASPMNSDSMQ
jgi:hypothetical protein